ncbi:MAG: permease-like cell division protein FtsX [Clostridia bacterium]|nr:permease-like cell division protein FtsX [Clostridia bacterium]
MNYNILSYLIGEGFKNVLKNKKSTFAALIIMFATMITVGIGLAGAQNITSVIKQLENDVPVIVFVKDGLSTSELDQIEDYIKSIEYVNNVSFTSKADALKNAKEKLADNADLLEKYSENNHPFKASYSITLTDINKSKEVIDVINASETIKESIEEIQTSDTVINGLNKADKGVKIAFFSIGALLIVVSTVIIGNTIKLTVHARRREISIMKYVGATNNFIRAPFVVEGIVIGIVATAVSILSLGGLYTLIYSKFNSVLLSNFKFELLQFSDIFQIAIIVYAILGIGIGVFGSVLSMKKYLKV